MGSKAVEDLIEAVSGVHFSGFHLGDKGQSVSGVKQRLAAASKNAKQPFVIGTGCVFISAYHCQIQVEIHYFRPCLT